MISYRELFSRLSDCTEGKRCYECIGNVPFTTFFQREYTHFHFHKAIGYSVNRLIAFSFMLVLLA